MDIYDQIMQLLSEHRELNTRMYELSERRNRKIQRIVWKAKELFGPSKNLNVFRYEILAHEGAKYLIIDWNGLRGHISNGGRMTVYHVELRNNFDDFNNLWAYDTIREQWICKMSPKIILDKFWNDRPEGAWRGFYDFFVLPRSGKLVDKHPVMCGGLANLANTIIDDENFSGDLAEICVIDSNMDQYQKRYEEINQEVRNLPLEYYTQQELDTLDNAHPTLVSLLNSMDWDYHYSDMFIKWAADQDSNIKKYLDTLELDDAVALFILHNPICWSYISTYLQHHHELKETV